MGFWKTTVCCLIAGVLWCYTSCGQICCCKFCDVGVRCVRRKEERNLGEKKGNNDTRKVVI